MARIQVKRGTRAQLDGAAGSSGLHAGEPYLITDEERLAIGLSANTYRNLPAAQAVSIACSDETSDLTVGTAKATFRMPFAMKVAEVRASVAVAPIGSAITVDINEEGASILSTELTIDSGGKTSTTAAVPPIISDSALADDAEITVDIDSIGVVTAGAGLKITLIGEEVG